jgi:hypothetical protein
MSELVVEILEDFLGGHKKHYPDKGQISFDCPECSLEKGLPNGDGKGNLEVNYDYDVYKCWACSQTHGTHGTINKLIRRYGNKKHLSRYKLLKPETVHTIKHENDPKCIEGLPKEFIPLSEDDGSYQYKEAIQYLTKRRIGEKEIKKYNIGYAKEGDYMNRVIFPSYDKDHRVNYFLGRSFQKWNKLKYKNPEVSKMDIIFNEGLINWDSNVYIVEGVFDHVVIPNSIPLLGKVINEHIYRELINKLTAKVIIVLDSDAYNDAIELYKKLNSGKLHNRVLMVKMPNGYDISDVHQKLGKKGVVKLLKSAGKLKESLI